MMKLRNILSCSILSLALLGCAPELPQGEALAEALRNNFRITDIELTRSRGESYWGGVVRVGGDVYLMSESWTNDTPCHVEYLGRRSDTNMLRIEGGMLSIEYWPNEDDYRWAHVPFGSPEDGKYAPGGFTEEQEPTIEKFIPKFKRLLRNDDATAISKMIVYPISVCFANGDTHATHIVKNAEEFRFNYLRIFYPEFKQQLLEMDNFIICDYYGLNVGRGLLRLQPGVGHRIMIVSIRHH